MYTNQEIDHEEYVDKIKDRVVIPQKEVKMVSEFLEKFDLSGVRSVPTSKELAATKATWEASFLTSRDLPMTSSKFRPEQKRRSKNDVNMIMSIDIRSWDFRIFKTDDDWFYIESSTKVKVGWTEEWFKCDSIGGLIEYLGKVITEDLKVGLKSTSELKKNLKKEIDKINDETKLKRFHEFIKTL